MNMPRPIFAMAGRRARFRAEWFAGIVPATGLDPSPAPNPAPNPPIPPGTPACRAGQLEANHHPGAGFAGHVTQRLFLRDRSGVACALDGVPDLAVLDIAGQVLAHGEGPGAPSFGPMQTPAAAVLMQPGTPALPPPGEFVSGYGVTGQAIEEFEWADCREPRAAHLAITLPGGGGRLTIAFPLAATQSPACAGPGNPNHSSVSLLDRGPLVPSGVTWPPAPAYVQVAVSLQAPPSVRRGSTLVYYVTITNTDVLDYRLDPCPDYIEFVGPKEGRASFQLNCGPVGHLGPGESVTFQMQLSVPPTATTGQNLLTWVLSDGRVSLGASRDASVTLTD